MSRRKNDSAQILFGLWLLPLGNLVYRSGSFPKVLAVLLAIGVVGYVVDLFTTFLAPGIAEGIGALVIAPGGGRRAVVRRLPVGEGRAGPGAAGARARRRLIERGEHRMKAIVQDRYGSADVLEFRDVEDPVIGEDGGLVRVRAAGAGLDVWHLMTGVQSSMPHGRSQSIREKTRAPA